MRLPELADWLAARFGESLAAPAQTLSPVFILRRAAGASPAGDGDRRDWAHFAATIRELNRLEPEPFRQAFAQALSEHSRSGFSLNRLCGYICDASETALPDVHGPAISAFRLTMGLKGQMPPPKLRWILRNSVVAAVHQHRLVKFRMAAALAWLWQDRREAFEKACLDTLAPLPKAPDLFSLYRYRDMTAMEMLAILWEGHRMVRGSARGRPPLAGLESFFAELGRFGEAAWATALLIDEKATLALLAMCRNAK